VHVDPALDQGRNPLMRADESRCVYQHCHVLVPMSAGAPRGAAREEVENGGLEARRHGRLEGVALLSGVRQQPRLILIRHVADHVEPFLVGSHVFRIDGRLPEQTLGAEVTIGLR